MFRRISLQFKFGLSYIIIIVAVLALMNTYPLLVSQNLVFRSKETSLSSSVKVIESSLSGLAELTEDNVAQALSDLRDTGVSRILVTDRSGRVLYDTRETGGARGLVVFYTEVAQALAGNDAFYCRYDSEAFLSRAAAPVVYRNQIVGAVYAYEYDAEQAALLRNLQKNLTAISVMIGALVLLSSMVYNGSVTVGNIEEDCYALSQESGGTPVLTVKNRPWTFRAVKKDAEKGNALEGVKFALHRKKTVSGVTDYDLTPEPGFEELVTGTDGVIPKIDQNLPAGSYELREKAALDGYQALSGYIHFTVGSNGVVSLDEQIKDAELTQEKSDNADGTVAYTLTVKNSPENMTPPPTGIHLDTMPYGWMFLIGCLLLAGAVLPAVVRRRRSDR